MSNEIIFNKQNNNDEKALQLLSTRPNRVKRPIVKTNTNSQSSNAIISSSSSSAKSDVKNSSMIQSSSKHDDSIHSTFTDLGLSEWIVSSCSSLGIMTPTPIQRRCIPSILQGNDVIGHAQTGSGKTAAFALPILQILSQDPFGVFALILTPARELALQIAEQFRVFAQTANFDVCVIIGGIDMMSQSLALSLRPHLVIATPGRLADHLRSSASHDLSNALGKVRFVVFDEADRLLEPCFEKDLSSIIQFTPSNRQTLLFSATMSDDIERIHVLFKQRGRNIVFKSCQAGRDDDDGKHHSYEANQLVTVERLEQLYTFGPVQLKECYLVHILTHIDHTNFSIIVFVGSCNTARILCEMLLKLELQCVALHSNINQRRRMAALGKFRNALSPILIATDVAARGLDIPNVDLVINFDVPRRAEDYVHRVGRTARAGRTGRAITLLSQYDLELFAAIEQRIGRKLDSFATNDDEAVTCLFKIVDPARRMAKLALDHYSRKQRNALTDVTKRQRQQQRQLQRQLQRQAKVPAHDSSLTRSISKSTATATIINTR